MRWLPTIRAARPRSLRRSNASRNADGPRLGKTNGWPVAHAIAPRTVKRSPAYRLVPRRRRIARRSWVSPQSTGGSVRAIDRDTRTRTPNYARAGRGDMFATLPDALRLFVVPVFAWAALQDVRTRRLPNRLWPPLYAFGALLLIWELAAMAPLAGFEEVRFAVRAAISLLFVCRPAGLRVLVPRGVRRGRREGADRDRDPLSHLSGVRRRRADPPARRHPARRVLADGAHEHGPARAGVPAGARRKQPPPRGGSARRRCSSRGRWRPTRCRTTGACSRDDAGTTRNGLDLDALRMYLRWRGATLADLRENPDRFRDPDSVGETHDPTDGGTHVGPRTDGGP